jgi:hypothetical protein
MTPLETKTVKIGDLEFFIRYSNRALLAHLNRSAKEPDNIETVLHYFYDLSKIGAKAEGKEFNYSFEEFYDLIDPYPDAIGKFNEAIVNLFGPEDKKK